MLPLVTIVGRANVGKSTLFNRLIRSKKALTHERPGVTRDRLYGEVFDAPVSFALVDTGGLNLGGESLDQMIFDQAEEAIKEAQLILFVVDARDGLTALDEKLAQFLRKSNKPVHLVINKVDGPELVERLTPEFYRLGLNMNAVSAAHGFGCAELLDRISGYLHTFVLKEQDKETTFGNELRLALLGRPNVGKSSLINALIGEKRLIVNSEAGTTRDSVDVVLAKDDYRYIFLDTAGVRRRTKIKNSLERFSVLRALKTSKRAQVTVLVLDAVEGVTSQDKKLLAFLEREKTPLILAVNKIDLIDRKNMGQLKKDFARELQFSSHIPVIYTSSITKAGLGGLLPLAEKLWSECRRRAGTGELNRALNYILKKHQPPMVRQKRPKFYYLTQADTEPPTFVFFMNDHTLISSSYARYLEKQIRKYFGFNMAPVDLVFRTSRG